ncbi:hypothetical protein PHMEG_0006227 [Phytophthora megakarya]|uniref:Uncharacterized protein n=1 Tax=Phytophthora megakarya TaxID=4795 RepID=A0A225WPE9_9STRA|nr:hypothetical protein PHMEG_0006227 [Phytophthora megakarya]
MGYSPNELLLGRRLRTPNELLRTSGVTQIGPFADYHRSLVDSMAKAATAAHPAFSKDQRRRKWYYNRRVRQNVAFRVGDSVWVLRLHEPRVSLGWPINGWFTGYDNWKVKRDKNGSARYLYGEQPVSKWLVRGCGRQNLG